MKGLQFKHYFKIVDGKLIWEDPQMYEYKKRSLEGKRGYAIIEQEPENASTNQFAYYFGGIIRNECLNSEAFQGWTEAEVHNFLLQKVRGTVRIIHNFATNKEEMIYAVPDFHTIHSNKQEMAKYISEVIAMLNTEFEVYPKPAEHYKYNKFQFKKKVYE